MAHRLERTERGGIAYWTDPAMSERGLLVAFTERGGGVSSSPYASLDLAAHVGDDTGAVDENRRRALEALGIGRLRERLVTAEQVHGTTITRVTSDDAGRGAFAAFGPEPVPQTDGLATTDAEVPLLLLFADCVPIVLVAPSAPAVAVLHAGWRGALGSIPGVGVTELSRIAGVEPAEIVAYVGAHICPECYEVGDDVMSQFVHAFVTVSRAESNHLDLGAAVSESLMGAGVPPTNVVRLGSCTAETTDSFFSYRAERGVTGRHGALACILGTERPGR